MDQLEHNEEYYWGEKKNWLTFRPDGTEKCHMCLRIMKNTSYGFQQGVIPPDPVRLYDLVRYIQRDEVICHRCFHRNFDIIDRERVEHPFLYLLTTKRRKPDLDKVKECWTKTKHFYGPKEKCCGCLKRLSEEEQVFFHGHRDEICSVECIPDMKKYQVPMIACENCFVYWNEIFYEQIKHKEYYDITEIKFRRIIRSSPTVKSANKVL